MNKRPLITTLALLALPSLSNAATVLTPTDDSYSHNVDTVIHGAETIITNKYDIGGGVHVRIGYLKFDLSAYAGQTITSAQLTLTAAGTSGAIPDNTAFTLYGLKGTAAGNDWSEDTLTGADRPAGNGHGNHLDENDLYSGSASGLLSFNASPADGGVFNIGAGNADLLSFLNATKELTTGNVVTFMFNLSSADNDNTMNWYTKEDVGIGSGSRGSTLSLAVPEPSSVALLGLGGIALIMRRRK
ncbi:DNRLRE domain-containing protein [Oceaniferula marina]|nr:DNRLRE domain-containing protein [Oceaniferula marina]